MQHSVAVHVAAVQVTSSGSAIRSFVSELQSKLSQVGFAEQPGTRRTAPEVTVGVTVPEKPVLHVSSPTVAIVVAVAEKAACTLAAAISVLESAMVTSLQHVATSVPGLA